MTHQTPAHGTSRALGNVQTFTGQALKAPHSFAGRPCMSGSFSVTGGSGACDAPNLPVGPSPAVAARPAGAF